MYGEYFTQNYNVSFPASILEEMITKPIGQGDRDLVFRQTKQVSNYTYAEEIETPTAAAGSLRVVFQVQHGYNFALQTMRLLYYPDDPDGITTLGVRLFMPNRDRTATPKSTPIVSTLINTPDKSAILRVAQNLNYLFIQDDIIEFEISHGAGDPPRFWITAEGIRIPKEYEFYA